jgi:hypothetical protein
VTWNDPADGYRQRIEYVEDHEGISRFGVVESEFVAVGCTSRGQAHRIGKWLLYSERMETEVISFKTGLEGAAVYPGAIIKTIDPHRAGKRHGGRVLAATTTVVDLDAAVEIESGATYTLSVMLPDGSIEDRAISNEPGPASTLTPATPFSAAPQTHAIWVLAASNLAAETWRVLTVREADKASVEISALKYYPQKYAYVEQGIDFEPPATTAITLTPAPVSDIKIFESLYLAALGVVGTRATVSWSSNAARYKVEWRIGNENWQAKESIESSLDIDGLTPGVYEFRITPIDGLGGAHQATTIVHELHGKLAPPVDVSSLSIQAAGGLAVLTWAQHPDLDVRVGGRIHFRHSDSMVGATWQSSVSIGEAVPGGATLAVMPLKPGTYLAKAEDSSTVFSLTAASVSTKQASVLDFIPATSVQEDDEFSGAHSGTVGFDGILKLMADATVDDVPDLDALSSFDISGGVRATGTYTFAAGMDLGNVTRCRLTSLIRADTINVNDLIDTRASTVDDWGDFDGTANADCDAWVEVRETDDNPAETPDWSDWRRLDASEYAARAFQFRAQLASNDPAFNIHITHLRVSAQTLA